MVKSAARRVVHYNAKLDGDVINQRITALKDMMVEEVHVAYAVQAFYEEKIKRYLEPIGMFGIQQHHYMNFGGELWRITSSFTGATARLEAELKASKWAARGLNPVYLIAIAAMFGIDLSAWTP